MSILLSGTKGVGKTYYGLHTWARGEIARTGYPLLAIDPRAVETLEHLPHAQSVGEVLDRIYGRGLHTAFTPRTGEQFDQVIKGIGGLDQATGTPAPGKVVLLVDEIRIFMNARHVSVPMIELGRVERNYKVQIAYTTQSYGDVNRELTCDVDAFFLFRHAATQDLDAIGERFGRDVREAVEFLPDREFILREVGKRYGPEKSKQPPAAPPGPPSV